MKRVLLISNKIFHYRIPIYNYFSKRFSESQIEFILLSNEIQNPNQIELKFRCHIEPYNLKKYIHIIKTEKPIAVIQFMHLSDWISWPLLLFCKLTGIKTVYWNHGINLLDPNNNFKNLCYNFFHKVSDAIILYSHNEKKFIKKKYYPKIFIANNTLDFRQFPDIPENKQTLKKNYGVKTTKIVLFVSRIRPNKRIEDLLRAAKHLRKDIKIVIVGPGLSTSQARWIKRTHNVLYLGAIYDENEINKIFKMSDIFCIPGLNGLSLNQAFYWGLPSITEDVIHAPEIVYLKHGKNGFIVPKGDYRELASKINYLSSSENTLKAFSESAKTVISHDGSIFKMYTGFKKAIGFLDQDL